MTGSWRTQGRGSCRLSGLTAQRWGSGSACARVMQKQPVWNKRAVVLVILAKLRVPSVETAGAVQHVPPSGP